MKKILFAILFIGIAASKLSAQGTTQLNYGYSGFNAIVATGTYSINVEKGDAFSVSVIADNVVADRVKVEVKEKTLHLYLEDGQYKKITHLRAHIVMPELTNVTLAGNTKLISEDTFVSEKFTATISGGTGLEMNVRADEMKLISVGNSRLTMNAEATKLNVSASGGSTVKLSGKALDFSGVSSGNSKIDASEVDINDIKLSIAGGSEIMANAQGDKADISAAGNSYFSSKLSVSDLKMSVSGGSKVVVSGETDKLSATSVGNSVVEASDLSAKDAVFSIAGGSSATAQVVGERVEAALVGNSVLTLRAEVQNMKASAMGGSSLILSGKGETFSCSCAGNASIKSFDFVADDVSVVASGGCDLKINAQNTLKVESIGNANVTYMGNPSVTSKTSGNSKIKKR